MSRQTAPAYHSACFSTTPSRSPPAIAPGTDPMPPSIMAISPLKVACRPNFGVMTSSVAMMK